MLKNQPDEVLYKLSDEAVSVLNLEDIKNVREEENMQSAFN
jgi:hypothetical protein